MMKRVAIVLLGFLPGMAFAHQDRILPIKPDGTLAIFPPNTVPSESASSAPGTMPAKSSRLSFLHRSSGSPSTSA